MFRVVRVDDNEYKVEERGLCLWWNAAFVCTYAGDYPKHFKTLDDAVEWIAETKALRREHIRHKQEAAKNVVVWADEGGLVRPRTFQEWGIEWLPSVALAIFFAGLSTAMVWLYLNT